MSEKPAKRERTFDELDEYTRNRIHVSVMSLQMARNYIDRSLKDIEEMFKDLPEVFYDRQEETK